MSKYDRFEDEIPTSPGLNPHPDFDTVLGRIMLEVIQLRKRVEALEAVAPGQKVKRISDRPGPDLREVATLAKKTIQWTVFIIAAAVSAAKELGFLKP